MGYVFGEILPWVLGALVIGFLLGLLFWWCTWWLTDRRRSSEELMQLRRDVVAGKNEAKELTVALDARQDELSTTTAQVKAANVHNQELETQVASFAAIDVESMQARIGELEGGEAETTALRANVTELEAERDGLSGKVAAFAAIDTDAMQTRISELEGENAQLTGLQARIDELEGENAQLATLQTRIGELEGENAQVAGLQTRISELEGERDGLSGKVAAFAAVDTDARQTRIDELEGENAQLADLQTRIGELEGENKELATLRHRITQLEGENADLAASSAALMADSTADGPMEAVDVRGPERESDVTSTGLETMQPDVIDLRDGAAPSEPGTTAPSVDLVAAAAVLGTKIKLDDLTVVEGIGPKISELCHAIGITTWRQLAQATPERLHTMLNEAGPRYRTHDPGTWPRQAQLLTNGRWVEFRRLTDELSGGR